jgi:hypothetical protein
MLGGMLPTHLHNADNSTDILHFKLMTYYILN